MAATKNGARNAVRAGALIALVTAATALTLHLMGRVWICTCGQIRLWAGGVNTADNSQQVADWYSFSHMIHGMIFYAALHLALPRLGLARLALGWRLLIAVIVECGWELLENSPLIIDRYRAATIAIGYTGDSILNSVSDVAMMALGFGIAAKLPWRWTLGAALAMEIGTLILIRDNLTLNVIMLAWPIDAIRTWQAAI